MMSAFLPRMSISYMEPPAGGDATNAAAPAGHARPLGRPLLLPDADGQDDHLDARELEATLDGECRFVVERAREQGLALEDELAREHHGAPELLLEVEADVLEFLDQVGAEREAVFRVIPHALPDLDVL